MIEAIDSGSSACSALWRYEVTATLPNRDARDLYLEWLHAGHVSAVCAWAERAEIVSVVAPVTSPVTSSTSGDEAQSDCVVKSVYWFEIEERFNDYEREGAPALRAEGIELSKRIGGVTFERSFGWSREVSSQT